MTQVHNKTKILSARVKKISFSLLLIAWIVIINPPWIYAESSKQSVLMDTIIVTGERSNENYQTGDVDLGQTTSSFTIINREKFEGLQESLAEVLQKEVGISIQQTGGLGSYSTVSLRGSASNQVTVYMDGVLINDGAGGSVNLSNISLSDVESIQVFRGSSPVNFGKPSLGGVINITTRRSKPGFNGSITGAAGAFGTRKISSFLNHKPGKFDYLISADYTESDNNYDVLLEFKGKQYEEHRRSNHFRQKNFLTKAGYDITDNLRVDLFNQYFLKDKELPNKQNARTFSFIDTEKNSTTLKITADNLGPLNLNTSTRLNFTRSIDEFGDLRGKIGTGNQFDEYTTDSYDANFFIEWLTDKNALSLMSNYKYTTYQHKDLRFNNVYKDYQRQLFSFGIQNSLNLFESRLIITPTIHYLLIKDEVESLIDKKRGYNAKGLLNNEDYISYNLGLKYYPGNWITLKGNAGKYVREPQVREMFGDYGSVTGNSSLTVETGINYDAGFKINKKFSSILLQRLSLNTAWFKRDVDDGISMAVSAQGIGKFFNSAKIKVEGREYELNLDFLKYFHFTSNITIQKPRSYRYDRGHLISDGRVWLIPGKLFFYRIEGKYKFFKVFFEYMEEKDKKYIADLTDPPKYKSNAGFSVMYDSMLFTFEATNLRDHRYVDIAGSYLPGISWYCSLKYTL